MSSKDQIRFSGDLNVEKILLIGKDGVAVDIRPQVVAVEIIESMFQPFTEVKVYVNDTTDVFGNIKLSGEELINIVASTPSMPDRKKTLDFAFHAYKVSDMSSSGDRTSCFTIHGISFEADVNISKKISKSYSGNISDLVQKIATDTDYGLGVKKKVNVERTVNSTHYISNFWSPTRNIAFLADRAISTDGYSSYVFFENRNGFNFVTLDTLYNADPIQKFSKNNFVRGGQGTKSVETNYATILDIQTFDLFDYFQKSSKGVYGSILHTYDLLFKLQTTNEFNPVIHASDTTKFNKENKFTGIMGSPNSLHFDMISHHSMYQDESNVSNYPIIQKRMHILASSNYESVQITVPGRTDYTVGYTVELDLPKDAPINKEDSSDKTRNNLLSGKYLIVELNHAFNGERHDTIMTLIRDTLD